MNRILIISAVFPPEPVVSAKLSFDLATALHLKGNQVTVIAPPPTRPMGFKFPDQFPKFQFNYLQSDTYTCAQSSIWGRLKESKSFGLFIKKHLEEHHSNYDLIYMNSWPFYSQYYTVKTAKKFNIPVINHIQDVYPESLSSKIPVMGKYLTQLFLPNDRYILQNCFKVIAISERMRYHLINTRNLKKENTEVVINWQDESDFINYRMANPNQPKQSSFTFMYMGNVGPVAGVDHLIESFKIANLTNAQLVIAGSGSMKESLINKVKQENIANVLFWDVPDGKVPEIQSNADVLMLPMKKGSGLSSIPSKLPAYMFTQKPIIACVDNGSDTGNCILEAGCGYVIEPENIQALANQMNTIISLNNAELNKMGENGFNYAIKHLSKTENLKRLSAIFNK